MTRKNFEIDALTISLATFDSGVWGYVLRDCPGAALAAFLFVVGLVAAYGARHISAFARVITDTLNIE